MPLPRGLPVVDHHCHLSPKGDGVRAAERFRSAGGTHLFLATQNYEPSVPLTLESYARQFETTCELARKVHEEVGVRVYPVLAPYPIDLVAAASKLGGTAALDLHRSALDLAGRWVRERKAVALGEVGRPHFPVSPEVTVLVEGAFRHALEVARDSDCPVVVHSADLDSQGFVELSERAREAGLRPERVVKHYTRTPVSAGSTGGVVPSFLAHRDLAREVSHRPGPWFLETDYLDDPRRPGAVLDLATVPRRAHAFVTQDPDHGVERLYVPFVESVERVYGWRPEVGPEGAAE
ncbi:MAG TPA: TatD family hydrolase [Thermoplasmata archaeon]|nr:TatD family hydrolase [Thermoplasmata archaeon]